MKGKINLKNLKRASVAVALATSIMVSTVSPSYAAPKNPKASVKVIKKPTISKSSALYKELNKGLFDYEYYKANNPDVVAVLGSSKQALLNHFLTYGIYEGRQPNVDFNVNAYSSAYEDLQNAFNGKGNDYQVILNYYTHYVNYGMKEGREITTVAEANAAGIIVTKVGTDTPVTGQNTSVPAPSAPYVAPAPTPAPAPAPVITPNPKPETPDPEVTPDPEPETPAPEVTPDPEPETPAPEVTPDPEPETPDPEVTPGPEPETPAPEVTPDPEPETPAPHAHSFDEGVVTKTPSKTEEGVKTFTCDCGETKTEPIGRLTCDDVGHGSTHNVIVNAPTCVEDGSSVNKCDDCDAQVGDTVIIKATGHSYDNGVVTTPATEETEGVKTYTCSVCGGTKTEAIDKLPKTEEEPQVCKHRSYMLTQPTEATCISPVLYIKKCAECYETLEYNYVLSDTLNPTNHTKIVKTIDSAATPDLDGIVTYTCEGCGFSYQGKDVYGGCSHEYGTNILSENGKSWNICSICGEKGTDAGRACRHLYLTETVTQEATETQNGIVDRYCRDCEAHIDTRTIHAYKVYEIDLGNGEIGTVMGWVEDEYNNTVINGDDSYLDESGWSYAVFELENQYRRENNLNELEWNYCLQEAANLRAVESGYKFDHTRPNGEPWYTANRVFMSGENLGIGHTSPEMIMKGWKASEGHNKNLLYPTFRSVAVGVFHMYTFSENSVIPSERMVWAQNFSYIG